jgi:hypothetical protein
MLQYTRVGCSSATHGELHVCLSYFFLFECVMLAFQLPCSSLAAGAPIEAVCTHDLGVF